MADTIQRLKKSRLGKVVTLLVFFGMALLPSVYASEAGERSNHFGIGAGGYFPEEMKEAGIEITREWIQWDKIEPKNDNYNWAKMDATVQTANEAGIEVLGIFLMMPSWAKFNEKCRKSDFCKPKNINDFKKFAKKVAERYDGKHGHGEIKYFEIINEIPVPQSFQFNNSNKNLGYDIWLINGYNGVKEGNPGAKVLIGSFINPTFAEGKYVKAFIDEMLKNYNQYYDIIGFHVNEKDADVKTTAQYVKERMEVYGVEKPMWITETTILLRSGEIDVLNKIAIEVIKRYTRAFGEGVDKVFWYNFRGDPAPEDNVQNAQIDKIVGLGWNVKGTAEFHPRPAYYTYKTMASKLSGFSPVEKITDMQYKFIFSGKNPVYVLWSSHESLPLPAEITGTVKLTDYLGNEETKNTNEIVLTESPVFVQQIGNAIGDTVIKSAKIVYGPKEIRSHGDLWFSTWADDDKLYVSWGDGCGPGALVNNKICNPKVPITDSGIAFFSESIDNLNCINPCDCVIFRHVPTGNPRKPIGSDRDDKPSSLLYVNDKLYWAGHSPLGDPKFGYIAYSNDYGKTWTEVPNSPWAKSSSSNFRVMMFIQMGKNYALNNDGYVYALGIGKEFDWNDGVYLSRVPKDKIADYSAYEYYVGNSENTFWSKKQSDAAALEGLETKGTGSVIYHEGIERYIFLHTESVDQPKASYLVLHEAPRPWGPWVKVGEVRLSRSQWQSGYQPGLIAKDAGQNYVYFTMAGDNSWGILSYSLNIGKIEFELND